MLVHFLDHSRDTNTQVAGPPKRRSAELTQPPGRRSASSTVLEKRVESDVCHVENLPFFIDLHGSLWIFRSLYVFVDTLLC